MTTPAIARLSIRIINKGRHGPANAISQEMRVFVQRPDGSFDRVGTISASWGRITMLRRIIEAGARAMQVDCIITEPVRATPGLG